ALPDDDETRWWYHRLPYQVPPGRTEPCLQNGPRPAGKADRTCRESGPNPAGKTGRAILNEILGLEGGSRSGTGPDGLLRGNDRLLL
ncbi:MAG: hypothetical protein O3A87_09835, partial [Verrucomicrobia bacterium]|nr:hypothetical protein [Verrucomicrobiota bacterium]